MQVCRLQPAASENISISMYVQLCYQLFVEQVLGIG